MTNLPFDIGPLHFVGIGGIGMSGIAEVMHNLGYRVQGSDVADSANVQRLRTLGIEVHVGHRAENLGRAKVLVCSSAIRGGNPEVDAARAKLLPVVRRAEMLGELMRLKWSIAVGGTHGKTTTTSMVAALLDGAGYDPTVINGGIINAYGTNARLGQGQWMAVEADESDGTFVKLPATVAVVTNIDPEHLDHYGSFDRVRDAFHAFVENIPFYGFAVLCIDHPEVQKLVARVVDRRILTYGLNPQADIRATDIRAENGVMVYDVTVATRANGPARTIEGLRLPMLGEHNVQNSLVMVAIAHQLGIPDGVLRDATAGFSGVRRRFTCTGESDGITVIDDYGHHPVEIAAVLKAARSATAGRVIAVVQPHRYSRLQSLFDDFCTCFNDADTVVVAPVYAAGEPPIEGVDRDGFVAGLKGRGHRHVVPLEGPAQLAGLIRSVAQSGDLIVCLGAGNITSWAYALPSQLDQLAAGEASP